MPDNDNSISVEDIKHKLYITQDFIKDCMDSTATLTLFYAIFTRPYYVGTEGNVEYPSDSIPVMYESKWGRQWRNISGEQAVLVCDMPGSVSGNYVIDGFLPNSNNYLAVDFDTSFKQLKVRIPYFYGLDGQSCGILKYRKNDSTTLKDAFVFNTKAFNVGVIGFVLNTEAATDLMSSPWNLVYMDENGNPKDISTGDDPNVGIPVPQEVSDEIQQVKVKEENNDAVIYIDLSKLNIAATLKPIYTKVNGNSETTLSSGWYTDEHLHNLYTVDNRLKKKIKNETTGEVSYKDLGLEVGANTDNYNFGNIGSFTYDILGKTEVISNITNPNFITTVKNNRPSGASSTRDPQTLVTLTSDSIGRLYSTQVQRLATVSNADDNNQQINIIERNMGSIEQDLPPVTDLPIDKNSSNENVIKIYKDLKLMYLTDTYFDKDSQAAGELPISIEEIYEL